MGVTIREKKLKSGNKSLYLDIYQKGKRKYEFLDIPHLTGDRTKDKETRRKAEAIKAKREIQLFNESYDFDKKDDALLFTDFLEKRADEFKKRGNQNLHSVLSHVREYDKKDIPFDNINASWLKGFKEHLLKKVKQNTARTYFLILRSVLNKAAGRGLIKANPMYKFDIDNIKKDEPKIEYLSDEELNRLWGADVKNKDVKRAFLFSAYTGLRYSDTERLKWDDIEEIKNSSGSYKQVSLQQKKTNDLIHIPINKKAEKLLDVPYRVSEYVFDITPGTIAYWLPKWAKKAKVKKHLHFHMARHTFATRLLRKGVNIYDVSKLLGHKSISNTEKYLHIFDSDKKSAIDVLD